MTGGNSTTRGYQTSGDVGAIFGNSSGCTNGHIPGTVTRTYKTGTDGAGAERTSSGSTSSGECSGTSGTLTPTCQDQF